MEFKGSGNFSLALTDIEEYYSCSGFRVDAGGFIHLNWITTRCEYHFMANWITDEGEFEGLEGPEEYRKMVSDELKYIYFIEVIRNSRLESYPPHFPKVSQGRSQLIEYFREKVQETSLKEIIGHWP